MYTQHIICQFNVFQVKKILSHVEKVVGERFNIALVQWYRTGFDYIGEHADKTLDLDRGSAIVNYSLGATRSMILKPKRDYSGEKSKQRVRLTHNSLFVLGPNTNRCFTHAINQDRRAADDKAPDELAYEGNRISLTFRRVGTFLTSYGRLYGQGARCKAREDLDMCCTDIDSVREAERMIECFGLENRSCNVSWDELYSTGFDVLSSSSSSLIKLNMKDCVDIIQDSSGSSDR